MTPPFVERYLSTLNRYKWIELGSFAVCMGVAGVMALQQGLSPSYLAQGALTTYRPAVTFSATSNQIQEQGQKLNLDVLLADNIMQAVGERVKGTPQQIRQNTALKLVRGEDPPLIQVFYQNSEPKKAAETIEALLLGMIDQSRLINKARLQAIEEALKKRLQQASQDIKGAQQDLEKYNQGDPQERSRLEQRVASKKAVYDKVQAALADAEAAEPEIVSSLAIAQAPRVAPKNGGNSGILGTLGRGTLVGLWIAGGLIPLLAWMGQQPESPEFRRKLLATYKRRCAITGCEVEDALEPVCIDPYRNSPYSDLSNGLILRSDIQKLFNAYLLAIDPTTLTVRLAPSLGKTSYKNLAGKRLQLPQDEQSRPSLDALEWRYRRYPWIEDALTETEEKA